MNSRIINTLTLFKIISALLSLGYSIAQARLFGTSYEIEIFFAANSLVYLISSLTQTGQLAEVFLPVYHQLSNKKGISVAHGAFSVLLNRIIIFVFLALIVIYAITPSLVSLMVPGFSVEAKLFTIDMFRVMLLYILIDIVNSFINLLLNAENIFGRAELNSLFHTSISLILLWLLYPYTGIWTLVIAQFIGKLSGLTISVFFLRRIQYNHSMVWSISGFNHINFFKTIYSTTRYVAATQLFNIALTSSLSLLPQGIYAIFKYIEMLYTRTIGILIQPISTVYFTHASLLISKEKKHELMNTTMQLTTLSLILGLITFLFEFTVGKEALTLLWGSKAFEKEGIDFAYILLTAYFITFIGQGIGTIYRKLAISLGWANEYYNILTLIQLLSAGFAFFTIRNMDIKGIIITVLISRILFLFAPIFIIYIHQREYLQSINKVFLSKIFTILIFVHLILYFFKFTILSSFIYQSSILILLFVFISLSVLTAVLLGGLIYININLRTQLKKIINEAFSNSFSYNKNASK